MILFRDKQNILKHYNQWFLVSIKGSRLFGMHSTQSLKFLIRLDLCLYSKSEGSWQTPLKQFLDAIATLDWGYECK